jgi:hypothetical protein
MLATSVNFGRAYGLHPAILWAPPRRTLVGTRAILATTCLWPRRNHGVPHRWVGGVARWKKTNV